MVGGEHGLVAATVLVYVAFAHDGGLGFGGRTRHGLELRVAPRIAMEETAHRSKGDGNV